MNHIRLLREQAGVTQQTLAALARTSQPTIALYESGAKSPTLATLQRLALALGLELTITFTPSLTREDQRSLAYHQAVARRLSVVPASTIKRARRNLRLMRNHHVGALALFQRWKLWLKLPTQELISHILDPGFIARDMRQVTPFAGLIPPEERTRILRRFRREYGS